MISNIIHGCIDLSENADNFFKNLTKLIKDKPLYKVYGKIPIKLIVSYKTECIFPLKMEPVNSRNNSKYSLYAWDREETEGLVQTMFGSNRKDGRKHGGIDLYTGETTSGEVIAIADGKVLDIRYFYNATYQISIYHEINGKPYIVRYGELLQKSITHKIGDTVTQGEELGETGVLIKSDGTKMTILNNKPMRMLHFEIFDMNVNNIDVIELKDLNKYLLSTPRGYKPKNNNTETFDLYYRRRKDIINPLEILKQGYEASKKSGYIK